MTWSIRKRSVALAAGDYRVEVANRRRPSGVARRRDDAEGSAVVSCGRRLGSASSLDWRPALLFLGGRPCRRAAGIDPAVRGVQGVTGDPQRLAGQNRSNPTSASPGCSPDRGSASSRSSFAARGVATMLHTGPHVRRAARSEVPRRRVDLRSRRRLLLPGHRRLPVREPLHACRHLQRRRPSPAAPRAAASSSLAGKTTAWRNIFGNDPQALGQTLAVARVTHQPIDRLELNARASRVRTSSLKEFSYTIDAGDQVGGGAKLWRDARRSSWSPTAASSRTGERGRRSRARRFVPGRRELAAFARMAAGQRCRASPRRFSGAEQSAAGPRRRVRRRRLRRVVADASLGRMGIVPIEPEAGRVARRPHVRRRRARGAADSAASASRSRRDRRSRCGASAASGNRARSGPGFLPTATRDRGPPNGRPRSARPTRSSATPARENVEHLNQNGSSDQHDASAQIFANLSRTARRCSAPPC